MGNLIELKCDLLVAGGGIAGICAAVAAARKGVSVVLINDRSVLGGNASSEIQVPISGACHHEFNAAIYVKETGIVDELRQRSIDLKSGGGYASHGFIATDAVYLDAVYNEENINLILNTVVTGCLTENGRIICAYAKHSVNGNDYHIYADNYIDSTGNGMLAFEAGAEYRIGREAKSEFNESEAPEVADKCTMGNTILFDAEEADREVVYKAPDFAMDITKTDFFKHLHIKENFRAINTGGAHWSYEYGGQVDILNDHNDIEKELRSFAYGVWDYVKNSGEFSDVKNKRLSKMCVKAGTRESRRIVGDYILTENDIENKVNFEDSVAYGGWPMDVHAPKGMYDSIPASNFIPVTGTYNIPFRCLYSKNIENLMMAGRDISVTHIALGSTRVIATCATTGQAVGTAAYISKKYGATPREIYKNHIEELKYTLLADDQPILHIKEQGMNAEVSATSEAVYENVAFNEYMALDRDYALSLMLDSKKLNSFKIHLKAQNKTKLSCKIFTGIHPETYLPEIRLKKIETDIEAGFEGWKELKIDCDVGADSKICVVFEKNEDISIATGKARVMGAITHRMHKEITDDGRDHDSIPLDKDKTGYCYFDHRYEKGKNILFCDIKPKQTVFAAKNVINGYRRPYGTQNLWKASDNNEQKLILTLNEEINSDGFYFVFDNELHLDRFWKMPAVLTSDFIVEIEDKNGVREYFVKDNIQRVYKLNDKFKGVKKIQLTIKKTYGKEAGVYAIQPIIND